ncbi:hypothetical protein GH714_000363 [Hevea brasiliensis]|uniref:P5A-ATPase transmembrane helical hairpin domain-containing protein n=1 Tax=Hevea brasiliensis TaxID=3981 RepID=A0A6A6M7I5_HEVBR|nr:hypothetical protein GH714_000363 [Hevea brasiliensis]
MSSFHVGGKVVERVDLLRKKHWAWRLDVWPFAILYVLCITAIVPSIDIADAAIVLGGLVALHILVWLFTAWSVNFKCFVQFSKVHDIHLADACKITPAKFSGSKEVVPLHFRKQVFCVGLWCLDEYWYYSLFTLFMLFMFESTMAKSRLKTLSELRRVRVDSQILMVHRCGKWVKLPGTDLLPGDVCPLGAPLVSIMGRGTEEKLSIKRDKSHVLFGGTKILQHTPDKTFPLRTPDGGCVAVVLRTGFETSQGKLMRTILFSTDRVTANSWESGLFILFLVVFAVIAAGYVLKKVDICCFDKTGTLTSDDMVGDPLEKAALKGIDWSYKSDEKAMPKRGGGNAVQIVQRHHFASHLKRMAVVVRIQDEFLAFVKGAPETIQDRLIDLPQSYVDTYKKYTRQGSRVLALAFKSLPDMTVSEARSLDRDVVESGLTFAGFAVFNCPIRADSAAILSELKNSSHDLVMITGDQALTACHVAAVHIISKPALILGRARHPEGYEWISPDEAEIIHYNDKEVGALSETHDLCIGGDCIEMLQQSSAVLRVIPHVKVFARVAPEQKEQL